jgi:alpha-tubulin suppressor-like RCC1 family protein
LQPAWEPESLKSMSQKGPTLLHNATSVDVMRVSCAPRHAAIITRNGELYTWGYGKGGWVGGAGEGERGVTYKRVGGGRVRHAERRDGTLVLLHLGRRPQIDAPTQATAMSVHAVCPIYPVPRVWFLPPIALDCNLGHGWCGSVASPRLVARMGGRGVRSVSCGEGASAAISADNRLFMWGKGIAGQLGNGFDFPCAEPTPVLFPGLREDIKVRRAGGTVGGGSEERLQGSRGAATQGSLVQAGRRAHGSIRLCSDSTPRYERGGPVPVGCESRLRGLPSPCMVRRSAGLLQVMAVSCGPYHTAAITEGGLLFTWGNGLFGKLGHGSHDSEYRPRR